MAKQTGRQTIDEFIGEESARDPAFKEAFEKEKSETVARLGRPPSGSKLGRREMRLLVPPDEAERIRQAAEADGRTVSNWLLQAAREKLESVEDGR